MRPRAGANDPGMRNTGNGVSAADVAVAEAAPAARRGSARSGRRGRAVAARTRRSKLAAEVRRTPETASINFLGIRGRLADYRSAKFAVLPVPYDGTATYLKGTADGPDALIEASTQVELFDEA